MAVKRKTVESRIIDTFCVIPAREERIKAEKAGDFLRAEAFKKIENYCIEKREAAKRPIVRKKDQHSNY